MTAQDWEELSRLHCLGIHHGDTNRFNFLIRDSKAVLIDFDSARKCDDRDALLKEFEHLPNSLEDSSHRGGGGLLRTVFAAYCPSGPNAQSDLRRLGSLSGPSSLELLQGGTRSSREPITHWIL